MPNGNKLKTSKKSLIINIICAVVIIIIIAMTAILFISKSQNKPAFIFGKASVWIMTPSMEDLIPQNSYITVKKIDAKDVKVGDVIMFYSDDPKIKGSLNTHRVVEIVGDNVEFVTKGDNNTSNDEYTAKADKVVGIYTGNLKLLTAFMRFFLTKWGFATIIAAVIIITAAMYIPGIINKSKEEKAKQKELEKEELIKAEIERIKAEKENSKDSNED